MSDQDRLLAEIATAVKYNSKMLDKHSEMLTKHNEVLIKNTQIVDEHQRRSTALEKQFDKHNDETNGKFKELDDDLEEVKEHIHNVQGVGKLLKWIGFGTIITIAGLALKYFGKI